MFFVLIFLEWVIMVVTKPKALDSFRVKDAIMCTCIGATQQAFEVFVECVGLQLTVSMYTLMYNHCRLWTIDVKQHVLPTYFALLLGKDLGYYWFHRIIHEYHSLWTAHSVHHSGEDYNMATGLRQGALQTFTGWPFYVWMALLGFPPQAFAAHSQLNTM
jgi:alkylglycerol monooxygenase